MHKESQQMALWKAAVLRMELSVLDYGFYFPVILIRWIVIQLVTEQKYLGCFTSSSFSGKSHNVIPTSFLQNGLDCQIDSELGKKPEMQSNPSDAENGCNF